MTASHTLRSRTIADETPEWRPFLEVLGGALSEATSKRFDGVRVERESDDGRSNVPFLATARVVVPERETRRWLGDVLPRRLVRSKEIPMLHVLRTAIVQDDGGIEAAAALSGEDVAALRTALALAALPILFACRKSAPAASWGRGHCPVCAAWPVFAESRGLERRRQLRCGRCGADWPSAWLTCVFCGVADHRLQGALVPEAEADGRRVETCSVCRGFLKTIPTVSAIDPELVPLEDLATVAFDVEALERGFRRPARACDLACEVAWE